MTFARRVGIAAAVAVLVPLSFATIISLNYRENHERTRELMEVDERALTQTALLQRLVIDMETANRAFYMTGQELFLEPDRKAMAEYGPLVAELKALLALKEESELLAEIDKRVARWRAEFADPRIAFISAHPPVRSGSTVVFAALPPELEPAVGKALMDQIRGDFEALDRLESDRISRALAERDRAQERLLGLLWIVAGGFSLLLLSGTVWLWRSYRTRIGSLFAGIEAVERGSFALVPLSGGDEPGRLAAAFNRMTAELERRNEERQQAQEEIGRFFSVSLDLLCIADFNGYFKLLNPAWEKTLGFSTAELSSAPFVDFVHPEDRPATLSEAGKLAAQEHDTVNFTNRYRCADGSYKWLLWKARSDHRLRLIYCAARDVTDEKRAQEEIRHLNEELQHRLAELGALNRELEAFSYSVSHDLRAPLRHIGGFAELLGKSAAETLDERGRRHLRTIIEAAKKMGNLIDDLLSFSRMGRAEMHTARVNLAELVADARREIEAEAGGREVVWKVGGLPTVRGDASMLRLVFANLLSNAVKYTSKRSHAEIEVGTLPGRDGEAVVFVRDNGVGFDSKYVDRLFGVFQRLHRADEFEGTGIGLANVRRIIHRHGGRTWAEGAVDAGATFYFSLPLIEEVPA